MTNRTTCEVSITDFSVTYSGIISKSSISFVPLGDQFETKIQTGTGWPINYKIKYDENNSDWDVDELEENDVRMKSFSHNFNTPGKHTVLIELSNQHCDPRIGKVGHNITDNITIVVDPKISNWTIDSESPMHWRYQNKSR